MSEALAERVVTVYSRRGCHLCDDMLAVLQEFSETYHFDVVVRDVDADPALYQRYNTLVPVLCVGEQQVCHYFLDWAALRAALGITQ